MSEVADAWQGALAAEQQAVFGYGLLGPYLTSAADAGLARQCYAAHQQLRDATVQAMITAGQSPTAPAADYAQLYPVSVGAVALRLAVRLEQDTAASWRYLYAVLAATGTSAGLPAALRANAQTALTASAVRAVQWRRRVTPAAASVPFPGI